MATRALETWRDSGSSHVVRIGGAAHRIQVLERGSASAALLLVHGFPTASFDWRRVIDAFAARWRVLAPDLLGFGLSDKPRRFPYSVFAQADVVERLLAARGVESLDVVAHDLGDTVVQELLARELERTARGEPGVALRSVVFLNGGLFPEAHRARLVQHALAGPLGPLLARFIGATQFARSFAALFGPETKPSPAELDETWQLVSHDGGARLAPKLLSYLEERRVHRARWVDALCRAPCPLRLVVGTADPVSGASLVARYRDQVPSPDIVELARIGHYPQLEAPGAVVDACEAFWRHHDRPG